MKINFCGKLGAVIVVLTLLGNSPELAVAQTPSPDESGNASADNQTLPADIAPDSSLAQVIRLGQSGVSENVLSNYVNNSSSPFNLTTDQIIYLKDIGIPDEVVAAMIQRDQQLGGSAPAPSSPDTTESAPPSGDVSETYFYDAMQPYGTWVDVEGYGRCWRPSVVVYDSSWQPYCEHGHWVYTDDGWYWISDYSWGWAPFHYGRWFRDSHYGWCWLPDTTWGPSWVCWRYSDDYCGWAPLPPHCEYREGVGLIYNGVAVGVNFDFGLSVGLFTFVPTRNFYDPHPWRYRVDPRQAPQIYSRTTVINNFNVDPHSHVVINHGIPPEHIAAVTHVPIHQVSIREASAPGAHGEQLGRNGTLVVNRPHFVPNGQVPQHPAPRNPAVNGGNRNSNPQSQPQLNYQRPTPQQPEEQSRPSVNDDGNRNAQPSPKAVPNEDRQVSPPVEQPQHDRDEPRAAQEPQNNPAPAPQNNRDQQSPPERDKDKNGQ